MDATEYSLNVSRIESLMPPQKEMFKTAIEVTVNLIDNSIKNKPNLSGMADLVGNQWDAMIMYQIIGLWKGIGQPSTAQEFENLLTTHPEQRLSGFHLRDKNYPIFPPETLLRYEGKLVVLDESQLREIYKTLGGDNNKAELMFPTPKSSQPASG